MASYAGVVPGHGWNQPPPHPASASSDAGDLGDFGCPKGIRLAQCVANIHRIDGTLHAKLDAEVDRTIVRTAAMRGWRGSSDIRTRLPGGGCLLLCDRILGRASIGPRGCAAAQRHTLLL